MSFRSVLDRIGTIGLVIGMVLVVVVIGWNMFGQRKYGEPCEYALSCRSFYCLQHGLRGGSAQVTAPGSCTQSCETTSDCGSGATCVVLDDAARDDLPPFGKPDKACMRTYELQGDTTRH